MVLSGAILSQQSPIRARKYLTQFLKSLPTKGANLAKPKRRHRVLTEKVTAVHRIVKSLGLDVAVQ